MYIMGIDPTKVRTSTEGPEFTLGTLGATVSLDGSGTKAYIYVKAGSGGVTGSGYVCGIDETATADMATTTTAAAGTGAQHQVGVGVVAIAANGYGWLQIYGKCTVQTNASAAVDTPLGTTSTAGKVDDVIEDVTKVRGLYLTAAAGSATEVAGFANFPAFDEITNDT